MQGDMGFQVIQHGEAGQTFEKAEKVLYHGTKHIDPSLHVSNDTSRQELLLFRFPRRSPPLDGVHITCSAEPKQE